MGKKCLKKIKSSGLVGEICSERLPFLLKNLFENLDEPPCVTKSYKNSENKLPGQGPFLEYVLRGNKKRAVECLNSGAFYITIDHHQLIMR